MTYNARLLWGIKIMMRDGVRLNATGYFPDGTVGQRPCLLTLTPYISDRYHDRGMYFASLGYPFLILDVRGRGNSEGEFVPFVHDAADIYDAIEWLAGQSYCDGRVAMWGGSYAAYVQWAAAKECPPGLATIVPASSPYLGLDFPMRGNIFLAFIIRWLTYTNGRAVQNNLFADESFWSGIYRRWHESGQPFETLDEWVGERAQIFQEWIRHPEPDPYWDALNPSPAQYAQINCPILTITGAYDDDQCGALEHYRRHLKDAPDKAKQQHYLVIGPWDHSGTRTPQADVGGVRFGPNSLVDIPKLHHEWYDWTMCQGPRPSFLEDRVAYYIMGADYWKYSDTLENTTDRMQSLFLDSHGGANGLFSRGTLQSTPGGGGPDSYYYHPGETSGPEVSAEEQTTGGALTDQSVLLALGNKALVYHSAPFPQDLEIAGFFRLSLWISIDTPDTDFYVSIHEIALNGTSIRLGTDALRARYRQSLRHPQLITTRDPLCYSFERFNFVARQLKSGSRLRLVIAPMGRLSESTFAQKNYNGGGTVAAESSANARPVTVRVHHDAAHPSVLSVPIGRPNSFE